MRDKHVIIVGTIDGSRHTDLQRIDGQIGVMETVGGSIIKVEVADNPDHAGKWGLGMLGSYNADVLINRFDGSTITRKQYRRMCEEAR